MHYDVTIITVRPGTHLEALARLKETFQPSAGGEVLACWYSDIGALNQILLIRAAPDTMRIHADRERILRSENPFCIGEYIVGMSIPLALLAARGTVPGRVSLSPLLAAMHSITGTVTRFMHIWPYADLNERARLRAKAVADGLWPPPGGPDHLAMMQSDIYFPADFSPIH